MPEIVEVHRLLIAVFSKVAHIIASQLQDAEITFVPYSKNVTGRVDIRLSSSGLVVVSIQIEDCSLVVRPQSYADDNVAKSDDNVTRFDLNDEKSLDDNNLAIAVLGAISRALKNNLHRKNLHKNNLLINNLNNLYNNKLYAFNSKEDFKGYHLSDLIT